MHDIDKLESIIQNIKNEKVKITLTSKFKEGLGFTSLNILQLIDNVQKNFEIKFKIEDYVDTNFVNVETLLKLIKKRLEIEILGQ